MGRMDAACNGKMMGLMMHSTRHDADETKTDQFVLIRIGHGHGQIGAVCGFFGFKVPAVYTSIVAACDFNIL